MFVWFQCRAVASRKIPRVLWVVQMKNKHPCVTTWLEDKISSVAHNHVPHDTVDTGHFLIKSNVDIPSVLLWAGVYYYYGHTLWGHVFQFFYNVHDFTSPSIPLTAYILF